MNIQDELTTREAAAALNVSQSTVRVYASQGVLRVSRRISNLLLFTEGEIERYRRARRPCGNPQFVARQAARTKTQVACPAAEP